MISTVTLSTITVVAGSSVVASIGVFVTLILIGFLASKELLGASSGARQKQLSRFLPVSIVPLFIGFAAIVALKVAETL